jgi:hypothetical protein
MTSGVDPSGLHPMRVLLVAVIAALCAWSSSAVAEEPAPKGMVLLTVSGLVGESNRGPLDVNKGSLLAAQKIDFPKAFAFDRAMLLALPQGTVTATTTKELGALVIFKGRYCARCSATSRRRRPRSASSPSTDLEVGSCRKMSMVQTGFSRSRPMASPSASVNKARCG